jgi:hypothetical protein
VSIHTLRRGEIHHARAEDVYPTIEDGSVSLAIIDGPYRMKSAPAAWDKFKSWDDFVDWYRPHIEAWGRVCAPSSTLYLWGSDESEGYLRQPMREAGWTYKGRIIWDKGGSKEDIGKDGMRRWADWTEVCGMYVRNEWEIDTCAGQQIAEAAGSDDRNPVTEFFAAERIRSGMTRRALALHFPSASGKITGCVANWELGYNFPTWEVWQTAAAAMQAEGIPRERPYLVHPSVWPAGALRASYDHLRAEYDHLRAEYDHLRAEYEAARYPFTHPMGIGNVWRHGQVQGAERLRSEKGDALHPCQKPLAFYERMIRASSRPGDLVLEPYGGTCRAAVAIERLPSDEARRYICVEPDEDGRDYLAAVLRSLRFDPGEEKGKQPSLFGAP